MIHVPNRPILPCVRAFHKINVGYAVTTTLATRHGIWPATKHDAIFIIYCTQHMMARRSAVGLRMRTTAYRSTRKNS